MWAEANVDRGAGWDRVIFSDEKKFNLDGPDGFRYYWRDLRKEEDIFSRRQNGGGSVMIWEAFSTCGQSEIAWLKGRQSAKDYMETLRGSLLPFASLAHPTGFVFQQDNASIHHSRLSMNWLDDNNVDVLDWAAVSTDLNPIENAWEMLARTVYDNGRQYHSVNELYHAIHHAWRNMSPDYLKRW